MLAKGIKEYLRNLDILDSLLYLVACKLGIDCNIDDDLFLKLIKNDIIERDYINEKIIVKIPIFENDIEYERESTIKISSILEETNERIDEYRSKFKGIRTKSIGDKKQCIDNLQRWLIKNQEYTFDDILDATDYYIANTDLQYVSNADNFIYNFDARGNIISGLSIILETMKMGTIQKEFK